MLHRSCICIALVCSVINSSRAFEIINTTNTNFDHMQLTTRTKKNLYSGPLKAKSYAPISSLYFKEITKELPLTLTLREAKTTTTLFIHSTPHLGSFVEFSDQWIIERDSTKGLYITEINKQR